MQRRCPGGRFCPRLPAHSMQLVSAPALLLAFALALGPAGALAQPDARITYLSRQLEKGKDPRVRVQSALVLGATDDPAAVAPLCKGLADPSELVRAAAARALGGLGELAALDCLGGRGQDPDAGVAKAVADARRALEAQRDRAPSFYLAFGGVADRTGNLGPDVLQLADTRLRKRLARAGALLAPVNQPKATVKAALKQKKLKGFRLDAELKPAPNGGLTLALVCFTLPEQSVLGQVEARAAGGAPPDLVKALAPKAVEDAAATFDWSSPSP